jgi:hypothetical protein
MKGHWLAGVALALALLLGPECLMAQGYRGEFRVAGSFLELRGLERDSLPEGAVAGDGIRRVLEDGTIVSCIPDEFCRWFASVDEEESISVVTQDLSLIAWPGIRGLAANVHLRGRYGTDSFWPRSSQDIEAITAFVSYDRADFRFRGGRLSRTSGLGYYNFDGGSVLWRGLGPLRIEGFYGWSLARGLNAPRDGDLLREADVFAPDKRARLAGFDVNARLGETVSGTFTYQREMRTDQAGLYTERMAFDARALVERVTVDFSLDYDLAYDEFNEVQLRASAPVVAGVRLAGYARHYEPYFELWTIWGAFTPVGYTEGGGTVVWSVPGTTLSLEGGGAYRSYEETNAGADFLGFEEDGWRAHGRARWEWRDWFTDGTYRAERGSGAARYGGDLMVGYEFDPGTYLAVRGSSTQTFNEFRLGEQITSGGGVEGAWRIGDISLTGSVSGYSLSFDRARVSDWTQTRGYIGLAYRFGSDMSSREGGYR